MSTVYAIAIGIALDDGTPLEHEFQQKTRVRIIKRFTSIKRSAF